MLLFRQIFWSNWNDKQPAIQTATYDGYDSKSIITERIRTPNGLAIDYKARKLYWSDARLDKIERMNYDGSERMVGLLCGVNRMLHLLHDEGSLVCKLYHFNGTEVSQ